MDTLAMLESLRRSAVCYGMYDLVEHIDQLIALERRERGL